MKLNLGDWSDWYVGRDRTKETRSKESTVLIECFEEDTVAKLISTLQKLSPSALVFSSENSDESDILYVVEKEVRVRTAESYAREKAESELLSAHVDANKKAEETLKRNKAEKEKAALKLMAENPEFKKYVEEQRALGNI